MNSRRKFLKESLQSGLGLGAFFLSAAVPATAYAENFYKQTKLAMGTIVSITASQASSAQMEEGINLAFEEMVRLEQIFSRHNPNTPLSYLNSQGKLSSPPSELVYVLAQALKISAKTNELYNPCVKPLLDLFISHQNQEGTLTIADSDLEEARTLSKLSGLHMSSQSISFDKQGMGITLDSIAKGYIVDCASSLLTHLGIKNHIINAGGDILAKGYKAPNEPWFVAIENPKNPVTILHSLPLTDYALATSGSYQHFYDKKGMYHHIINPNTGKSPSLVSLTCKAPNAMLADAYSTALSLTQFTPESGVERI